MVQAISNDLRKRIVKAVEGGLSRNKASKRFDVAVSTVVNLMTHVKETGSIAPKKIGGHCKPKLLVHDGEVRALVKATPDATLEELVAALGKLGIVTSRSALDRHFSRIGWSFKKNSSRIRTRQGRRQGSA
jgi:putative transposase